MTGPRPTADAARALDIDPETLDAWGRLGIVKPVVSIDGAYWWDVEQARTQVRSIREGLRDQGL